MTRSESSSRLVVVLAALWLGYFSQSLASSTYRAILPMIKEAFKLSYTEAGLIGSSQFMAYMLMHIPAGYLVDRYGARRTIIFGLVGSSAGNFLFGLSTNLWQALLCRMIVGVAMACIFIPGHKAIADCFPPKTRGMAMGIFGGGQIGASLAGVLSPYIALSYSWGVAVQVLSLPGFFISAFLWVSLVEASDRKRGDWNQFWKRDMLVGLIRSRVGLALLLVQFVRGCSDVSLQLWLATFLSVTHNFPLTLAGLAVAFSSFLTLPSNLVGGSVSDRVGDRMKIVVISIASVAVIFSALSVTSQPVVLWVLIASAGWFTKMYRSVMFAMLPELFGLEAAGFATGLHNMCASFGGVVLPSLLGFLMDFTGSFNLGWLILGILNAVALIQALVVNRLSVA